MEAAEGLIKWSESKNGKPKIIWVDIDMLRRLYYEEEFSTRAIALLAGISDLTLRRIFRENGMKARSLSEAAIIRAAKKRRESYD